MHKNLPDQAAELKLPDDVDHVGESAAHVKEALGRFALPLSEGGLDAMTTVENFMDVWHLPANASRRPLFLAALADASTSAQLLALAQSDASAHGARVAMSVLHRLALCSASAALLRPALPQILARTQAAPPGQTRLMWLEICAPLLKAEAAAAPPSAPLPALPADFSAFLTACVAAASLFGDRKAEVDEIMCGELTGLAAAHILADRGVDVAGVILGALAKGGAEWRCERALDGLAELLLQAAVVPELKQVDEAAIGVLKRGAARGWRQCGLWVARYFPDEPRCFECGVAGKLSVCGRCHEIKFCGVKCQKEAWPKHKLTCVAKATKE